MSAVVAVLVSLAVVAVPAAHASVAGAVARSARAAGPLTVPLTVQQALARAASSGRAVAVPGATTATQTLAANPDGTLTLDQSVAPVRKRVGGAWRALDARLERQSDGSVSTAATTGALRLSGGGRGPLATMSALGKSLSVWLPVALPAPVLSGSTATYGGVLPGVDVQVTADVQGGFSEVLIVRSAAAAADPALRRLVLATRAGGLTVAAGRAGDITAADRGGHVVFAAPAPFMWDSAPPSARAPAVTDPITGQRVDARSGLPLASTAASPGEAVHTVPVGVAVQAGRIILTPDHALLTSPSTVFPVYIDPTFTAPSAGSSRNEWTTVNNGFPSQSYWKTTSVLLQVGDQAWSSPYFVARSFVNMPVPSKIYGATVLSAQLNFTEEWSPSCTAKPVQAWLTGAISSSTTWDSQPGWDSETGSQTAAHGYSSSCPAAGVGFNVQSTMQSAANGKWSQATFGLRAGDESDPYGWKQFADTATMSITYDHPPNKPGGLSTSPATSCTASTPTTVGDGNVSLYVPVSDPDGGTLGVTIKMWNTATGAAFTGTPTDPQKLYVSSGSTAVFIAHEADLKAAAGGAVTEFSWEAQATDYNETSSWSATCNFKFDPTRPGSPVVTPPATASIGQPATFTITPPVSGTTPSDYMYQLNGGAPDTVTASSGSASITVVPGRFTNTLTVTSQSAGGNIGDSASVVFNATPAATAADADLTGDGTADLLTAGSSANGLPPGLWLAAGRGNGQIVTAGTDLGVNGNGTAGDNSPADFAGAQVISGHFGGTGLQDVLAYYPSGASAGQANILFGSGDGSPIQAQDSGNELTMPAGTLTDFNGDNPVQVANADDTSGQGYAYPDLITVNGDSLDGYYLEFYPNGDGLGNYLTADPLATLTPAGGTDWNNWTIATAQVSSGTAMYLWDPATGALYLWENLAYNMSTGVFSYAQYVIADGSTATWNKGATLTLQAADINGDATPDLWAVGAGGLATGYLAALGSGTATLAAQPAQVLLTPAHTWALNDGTSGPAGAVADTTGTPALNATGSGNATWNTGDLFSPDVTLDGTNSALVASGAAINPAKDFSVSAWAMPAALGGVVVSQDMTHAASFKIYPDTTSGKWYFCMATADTDTATNDCASGGSVNLGVWTQLTATYQAATGVMNLYATGVNIASTTHTALTGTIGGSLQIGDYLNGSAHAGYFTGQIAEVQTWDQVVNPAQAQTPDGYYQPITPTRFLDTRYGTGGTTGPVGAGGIVKLTVADAGGIPATNVTAVAVNVTALSETSSGVINVYPDDTPRPVTSNLNYVAGVTIANLVILPVGADGKIDLYNASGGTTQLIVDISGYFTSDAAAAGDTTYTPMTPTRVLDTRNGTGAPKAKLAAGGTLTLQIGGANGIPAGVSAVAVNLTAVNDSGAGFLIDYADGTTQPGVSGLQFNTQTIAGMAIVPVGADGKIDLHAGGTGSTDVIGDVAGYFTTGTAGEKYHAIGATRMIDTRQDSKPVPSDGTLAVAQGSTVAAVNPTLVLNVTVVDGTSSGYLTIYPDGTSKPSTSNMDYAAAEVVANLALAATGGGTADIYNASSGTVQVVVDCLGYFSTG
ncbi:MAG TPA: DNRLRE domain-containing protein [Streptosporangiaceae bacterium]|nr:DNRLRE domain-containing protein [Streptosporangiaceae bacterium]